MVWVFLLKYGMDLYANEATWKAMEGTKYLGKVDDARKHILKWERPRHLSISISKVLGSVTMLLPQFYRFMKDGKSFVMLTDTGYVVIAWQVSSRMRMAIWLGPTMM